LIDKLDEAPFAIPEQPLPHRFQRGRQSDSVLMLGGNSVSTRPPLPRRINVGLVATGISLLLLVNPGQMALPFLALDPLMPRVSGCANFGAPIMFLAFFALAMLISVVLIGLGIAAIVTTALRIRLGLIGAIALNAVVMTLLLVGSLSFPVNGGSGALSLDIVLCVCALIPAAALVLLLSPSTFASWWRWPRVFTITVVATALLLLPGAAGLVSLGVQAAGLSSAQPAATTSLIPGVGCGGAR
jgi:hypothetical protein